MLTNNFVFSDAEDNRSRLVPGAFLFSKKSLYEKKASHLQLNFNIFDSSQLGMQEIQTEWNFILSIQRYTQFWFFREGCENSFSITFCVWFFRKIFLRLYSINWPNFIAWLPILLEILCSTLIGIVFFPVYVVVNFEVNFFLSSRFSIWP